MTHHVIGLDLAAEQSGVAHPDGTGLITAPKKAGKTRTLGDDLNRLSNAEQAVTHLLEHYRPQLVVIEDYAPGIRSAAAHRLAEISGVVRLACYRAGAPLALVNVKHLKQYATGKGGATKSEMATAALKRAGLEFPTEDECDAWWLQAMGLARLGSPVVEVPALHREALDKVFWPMAEAR
ncbi:crossover junction endodeoxyribonuclease RuvC [Herbidospora daliensis]|uniref:crossover junction endodeoxyribonuclease RuvC n=1 Tax=Herbidospora daliensis TaxID=295585 RepID=UPI000785A075|nr:crossover junction endodeoxyribonuclease RuvC [Herbidospora daliensis]